MNKFYQAEAKHWTLTWLQEIPLGSPEETSRRREAFLANVDFVDKIYGEECGVVGGGLAALTGKL